MTLLFEPPTVSPFDPTIDDDLTRRGFLSLTAILGLSACASDDDEISAAASQAPTQEAVTVEHKFGSTTIQGSPQRVLSLGLHEQDYLWALGVQPVAVHEWEGGYPYAAGPWTEGYRTSEPAVLTQWEVDVEWAAAQKPDLIVITYHDIDQATYDQLARIAPVVAHPAGHNQWEAPWRVEFELIAKALRKEAEAADVIQRVEDTIAEIKEQYPQFAGKTFNTLAPDVDQFTIYTADEANNTLFRSLGFEVPMEGLDEFADGIYINISYERLDIIGDLDAIIMFGSGEDLKSVTESPLWDKTRLAEEGRAIQLPQEVYNAISFNSPLSIPYFLAKVAPKLAAALDGDPDTNVDEQAASSEPTASSERE